MSNLLNASEIIGFAVHIEQNGYEFYTETAKKFNNEKLMALFNYLAGEELNHERIFKELQKKVGTYTPQESYPGEYENYMKDYLKDFAPKTNVTLKDRLTKINTIDDAIEVALTFEKESVVFFSTLKRFVSEPDIGPIDKIIQEEVNHVLKLYGFKSSGMEPGPDVDAL
ncbi:MAG: ferritin family protein [bacterium]|nr:ferritin family protein [bacterium]